MCDEKGPFVGARCQAPLVLREEGGSNTTSAYFDTHAHAVDQHGVCARYMRRHRFRGEGSLGGEHAVYITKEVTSAAARSRYKSTEEELWGVFLTEAEGVPR
jgi:hypothetical protein